MANETIDLSGLSRREAANLLDWWLEAGVDVAVGEEPRDWRQAKAPPAAATGAESAVAASPPTTAQTHGTTRPTTLQAYHAWLAETADLPLFRAGAARALPHGPEGAEVMVLSGVPAPEDAAEGRPIGGAAWALTERMLAAIGLAPADAYVAALSCFSGTGTRLSPGDAEACRESVLAQIALAAPRRLLLLGDGPSRLLLGLPLAQARGKVQRVAGVPTVATFHPRHLLSRAADKPLAWRDLLLLLGDDH